MKDITRLTDKLDTEYNEIMDRDTEDHIDGDSRNLAHNLRDLACLDRDFSKAEARVAAHLAENCPRCNSLLTPSDLPQYAYQCLACDEDFYAFEAIVADDGYFTETVESDGISGDDVNRRLREKRLGFKAPSEDWNQAGVVIHCIYPDQVPTKSLASVILYNMHLFDPIRFVAESLDEILADFHGMPVMQEKLDGARVMCDAPSPDWNCADCVHSGLSAVHHPCLTCCNEVGPGAYVPKPETPICNECGLNLEADGSCGNLDCSGEPEPDEAKNEAYHTDSAFARVSGVAESAYVRWMDDCKPVCQDNEHDDEAGCRHYDNDTRTCLFINCPRVWTGI
jgi:hypothetical protein